MFRQALSLTLLATPAIAANPTSFLQYGVISGQGQTITLTRIPVTNARGAVSYYDGSISFIVAPTGTLGTNPTVTFIPSPTLTTAQFQPGRYYAASPFSPYYALGTVSSGVGAGGRTVWTWAEDGGAQSATAPAQAVWQTVSPPADIVARLAAAHVPNNFAYAYGTSALASTYGYTFYNNGLLAAEQTANAITLISYTNAAGDQHGQIGAVVLTKCLDAICSNK